MTRVFKSKVDGWLAAVAIGPGLVVLPVIVLVLWRSGGLTFPTVVVLSLAALAGVGLPIWVFRTTTYELTDDALVVRSGPFRQQVLLTDIESIRTTRSPLSAPALSLDRLRLTFRGGRTVLVSPEDQRGFLAALARAGVRAAEGVSPTA